nr:hypothetical protein [Bradyrhizobium sp.]
MDRVIERRCRFLKSTVIVIVRNSALPFDRVFAVWRSVALSCIVSDWGCEEC